MSALHQTSHAEAERRHVTGGLLDSSDYMGEPKITHGAEGSERFEAAAQRYPAPKPDKVATPIPNVKLRVMEWAPGRFVTDLSTVAECHDARSAIVDAILSIEGQLEAHLFELRQGKRDLRIEWQRRARGALRAKTKTLAEVIARAEWLSKEQEIETRKTSDRKLVEYLAQYYPRLYADLFEETNKLVIFG